MKTLKKQSRKIYLKPYTVHYRNFDNVRLENCFYAGDAYEARKLAMELNKYIHDHPNSIDLIRCENQRIINLLLYNIFNV